ncbi:Inner membrane protein YccF [Smittium culicis]|uniref:Inner membrane protein YccF n=1 Tax=Smittium culicis TaxID=133412 RepID=A0A1R1XRB7_9FUNG|nr:Inner membrane protein YccF [Smittium culicis]
MTGAISFLGNLVWIVLGGWIFAIIYFLGGVLFMLTIVGIPLGISLWRMAGVAFLPFGKSIEVEKVSGIRIIFNIIWLLIIGWSLVIFHLLFALAFFVTIIGIPFAIQNLKLAKVALWPLGTVVDSRHI